MSKYLKTFSEKCKSQNCGSKASRLSLLQKHGYKIPRGFCLTTDALTLTFRENRINNLLDKAIKVIRSGGNVTSCFQEIQGHIIDSKLPQVVTLEVENKLKSFALKKVAIRSSALSEDSKNFSYAGMLETVLDVQADISLVETGIKKVWSSLFTSKILQYNSEIKNINFEFSTGVIIQDMISPQKSGVAFSLHPVTNDRNVIYIEETSKSADKIVDGEVIPETHVVFKKDLTGEGDNPWIRQLSEQLIRMENIFGTPVDVEWALDEAGIIFLQARPITTLYKNRVRVWTDDNVGEVLPAVVTPLTWSILGPMTNASFFRVLHRLRISSNASRNLFKLVNGKAYFNRSLFEQSLQKIFPSGITEKNKSKINIWQLAQTLVRFIYIGFHFTLLIFWLPILTRQVEKKMAFYKQRDRINDADTDFLLLKLRRILHYQRELMYLHVANTYLGDIFLQLILKVEKTLGSNGEKPLVLEMISNIGEARSASGGMALKALADSMRDYLEGQRIKYSDFNQFLHLCVRDEVLKKKIQKFLDEYGYMSDQEFELSYPRWSENPASLLEILHKLIIDSGDEKIFVNKTRTTAPDRITAGIHKPFYLKILYIPIKLIKLFNRNRENLKQRFIEIHFDLKKLFLIISGFFIEKGIIQTRSDVFFLEVNEINSILDNIDNKSSIEPKIKIEKNRVIYEHNQKLKHPVPMIEINGKFEEQADSSISDRLSRQGIPCSSGVVVSTARVIKKYSEADKFRKNEILITHSANPGWVPLFLLATGVLTEIGGALSHSAIIAREYGIPMIASVSDACRFIKTGDLIQLDGTSGVVKILKREMA